jgi:iron uptake system component EfeO
VSARPRSAPLPLPRLLAATAVLALLASGCGLTESTSPAASESTSGKQAQLVNITISNSGCAVSPSKITAGAVQFSVKNDQATKVTEAEFQDGGFVMGEQENLTPGLSGTFALTVDGGTGHDYTVYCPGAAKDRTPIMVTGTAVQAWKSDPQQVAAVRAYTTYVQQKVALLVTATNAFTAAVTAGDVAQARILFPKARYYYEQIEPVAESFGDLDPRIDGRIDDAATPADFIGFHRIEQALWVDSTTAGMKPIAAGLDADVAHLNTLVATVALQPAQIANGATELMNEVETSKITGEEDRYSHTDLSDFKANLVGAETAFTVLKPLLAAKDPALVSSIETRDAAVNALLATYATKPGYDDSGYGDYATVTTAERQKLTQTVDPYVNALSKMSGVLA